MDFIIALPRSKNGHDALNSMTDKFSKANGFVPGCTDWSAEQWAIATLCFWQTADWGIPVVLITDRDMKFLGNFWSTIFSLLQVKHLYSTAYHPQTDGQSKRTNQTYEIVICHVSHMHPELDWEEITPGIQWRLNGSPNVSTGQTPHRLLYGMDLRQPWALFRSIENQDFSPRYDAEQALRLAAVIMKNAYDRNHMHIAFNPGDQVYIRLFDGYNIAANVGRPKKFAQHYAGPFCVVKHVGHLAYQLELPPTWSIHPVFTVAMLEPAPTSADPFHRSMPEPGPTADDRFPLDNDRFEIERLIARRTRAIGRNARRFTEYLVRWRGFSEAHDEWIRRENLSGAQDLVDEFDAREDEQST